MAEAVTETAMDALGANGIGIGDQPSEVRRSRTLGDMPDHVGRRYFVEERGPRREYRLFEHAHDPAPVIRDRGHRLIVAGESAAVVRDLIDIARHRGWEKIDVSGSERFRRMVEQEARRHGIDVTRPRSPVPRAADDPKRTPAERVVRKERASGDFRTGVVGVVMETGEAAFDGRPGKLLSPYVDVKLSDGRIRRAWGAGLPAALARAKIGVGETILLRQDGTEYAEGSKRSRKRWTAERQPARQPDRPPDHADRPNEAPPRARDRGDNLSLGERFRRSSPRERSDDPELRAAQSQYIAAKALVSAYLVNNPVAAALVASRLEAMIATSLDRGGRFEIARTRERKDGRLELALDRASEPKLRVVTKKQSERHPKITKVRDRGHRR